MMKVFLINPVIRSPDNYPLHSLIKGVLEKLATVTEATYSDIVTTSGNVIRIVNQITLGEMMNVVITLILILTLILFYFSHLIWRERS
jgi:hypothetical protein